MRVRNKRKKTVHYFEKNPEYLLLYLDMLKQERYWRGQGQYYMARECQGRAAHLVNEKISEYNSYTKTENLYCPTKKSQLDTLS